MRHAGILACIEQRAYFHRTVHQGGGVEDKADSGGGIEGELGEGLSGLWKTFLKCDDVQISGKSDDGG